MKDKNDMIQLSPEALEARRAAKRAWYAANKDKARKHQADYWERKAAKMRAQQNAIDEKDGRPAN